MEINELESSYHNKSVYALIKRLIDIIIALLGLIFSMPLWLIIIAAIKMEDGGPIFFIQKRWGQGGSIISIIKFRTMKPNSSNEQAVIGDERITEVGRYLRALGLDELPQLLTIIIGDMSLVGPRPLAVDEIVTDEIGQKIDYECVPGFWRRLSVKPGLTSLSTIYLRKDINPAKKFKYDLIYIKNRSLRLDLQLILLSILTSIRGNWENRSNKLPFGLNRFEINQEQRKEKSM